jgi:hypothetical protein
MREVVEITRDASNNAVALRREGPIRAAQAPRLPGFAHACLLPHLVYQF